MTVSKETIRDLCTDAVFDRGQTYRDEGRIQRLERFDDVITAVVQGSNQYDVTVELGSSIDAQCTCPYEDGGECKHVVAVLLEVDANPPGDESERVETVIDDVAADDLRAFVRDALAEYPELREQFLAQYADDHKSVEEYREEIDQLFDQHTQDYPVVTEAIDFSQFFELAEQYRERERYLAAATVYRALFEEIDDNTNRIDVAYDHYAKRLQSAIDGYADCVLATDPSPEAFDTYAGVIEDRASDGAPLNQDQFRRALDDLENRYEDRQ